MNRKGFGSIIVLGILAAIIILGGIFYYVHKATAPIVAPSDIATTTVINSMPSSTVATSSPSQPTSTMSSLSPKSGPVGAMVTIHGKGFGADNTITMGGLVNGAMRDMSSTDGGTMLTFEVPGSLEANCQPDQACPQFALLVTPRAYAIAVITDGITQTIGNFTVTGGSLLTP